MKSKRLPLLFIVGLTLLTTSLALASLVIPPRDGVFTGSTIGYSGEVVVTLAFSNGRIEAAKIGHEESMDLGACEILERRIVDLQTPNVDAISGATVTSEAVVEAAFTAYENATNGSSSEPQNGTGLPAISFPLLPNEAEERPNVLLIVSEDNGPELGCYGEPHVLTPHLDQLAAEGCRFENAFVPHAVCSVSRASFLTGLYPFQHGQLGLATHRYAMFESWDNMPSILKGAGYRTGLIGKLHVNPESAFPFDFRWNESKSSGFYGRDMGRIASVAGEYFQESEQPFFLSVNYPDAHFPLLTQEHGLPETPLAGEDVDQSLGFIGADSERLRQGTADYYNCLMRLDSGIGMLLDALEESGKASNTIVIYIGDHGAQFSRGKATCFEGGLRIPMIIHWPEQIESGIVSEELVSTVDLLPTVLDAVGLPPRSDLSGCSLLPLARGEDVEWREYLCAERTAFCAASYFPQRTIRNARYKLILNLTPDRPNPVREYYDEQANAFFIYGTNEQELAEAGPEVRAAYDSWETPPEVELYDLENDPYEFRNLAEDPSMSKIRDDLLDALQQFRVEHDDPLLDPEKLHLLTEEHDDVRDNVPGGRYGAGRSWGYLEYLQQETSNR